MFKKFQPIAASLAPNYTFKDIKIAFEYLMPWKWNKLQKGKKPKKLEKKIRKCLDCECAISFDSGRSGLYTILKCLGIKDGDEIILQAFT
ncbi:MAG: DegT/DnrJ/EryC1/StrS family aminotransferase, partial [Candidatus Pacebacteria bacterium]|nr:DegT/DnrJ/EryC1/StrS family aminotransferase [Candidatus Paceibacterota bacterium]